jgi:hypothetical protein
MKPRVRDRHRPSRVPSSHWRVTLW